MQFEYSIKSPLNREPPVDQLVSSFLTREDAYDRNHGPIPHIKADQHMVRVDSPGNKSLELSIEDLRTKFKQHEIICALQCAGNRRHTMRTLLKEVDGIDWGDGAVMNCQWKGPRLRDVLLEVGVKEGYSKSAHVAFACFTTKVQEDDWYGGSIELKRAMDESADVILALEMNGKELTPNHGYPVRTIVPGVSGCRSVKWLDRITVQDTESSNHYQTHDYKKLPAQAVDKKSAEKFWNSTPALQDMPVNSVIAVPRSGEKVRSNHGTVDVKGYALPQGSQGPVAKVEVSSNDGQTWSKAQITEGAVGRGKWSWVLWKVSLQLKRGDRHIISRATDAGGNTQAASGEWNLRGIAYDGYGEVRIHVL